MYPNIELDRLMGELLGANNTSSQGQKFNKYWEKQTLLKHINLSLMCLIGLLQNLKVWK